MDYQEGYLKDLEKYYKSKAARREGEDYKTRELTPEEIATRKVAKREKPYKPEPRNLVQANYYNNSSEPKIE